MNVAVTNNIAKKATTNLPGLLVDVQREVFGDLPQSSHFNEPLPTGSDLIAEKFKASLVAAQAVGKGYRAALNDSLAKAYAAFHIYESAQTDEQKDALRKELAKFCVDAEINVSTGKTKPEHMIVRLAFGDELLSTTVSQRARLLRLAASKHENVEPAKFTQWLESKGGIVAALGGNSGSQSNNQRVSPVPFREHVDSGRNALKGKDALVRVDSVHIGEAIRPQTGTDTLCIVEVQDDGTFAIRAFVQDPDALDTAYAAYYQANAEAIDRTTKYEKITALLNKDSDLTIPEIRASLGKEVADQVKGDWEGWKKYNEEMRQVPAELEEYAKKLHKADRLNGAHEDKSESAYQAALDELEQVLEMYPRLALDQYLDRPYDDEVSLDRESMPRLKSSKSPENKGSVHQIDKQESFRSTLTEIRDALAVEYRETV